MRNAGMTLLEVMFATTIFILVIGVLYTVSLGIVNAHEVQEITLTTNGEIRNAMWILAPRLRQAATGSINWANLPEDSVTFMMAEDVDGNGFAVDTNGDIELVGPITIQRDENDANADGETMSQLVMIGPGGTRVLANNLLEGAGAAGAGPEPPAGVGFWVAPQNGNLVVTIRAEGHTARGRIYDTAMTEIINPRN